MTRHRHVPTLLDWLGPLAGLVVFLALLGLFGWLWYALLAMFSLMFLTSAGFAVVLMVDHYRTRSAPKRVSWPKVAELEHATGVFDTFVAMEWPGHTDGVGDACRHCAREAIAVERDNEEATTRAWAQGASGEREVWCQGTCPVCRRQFDRKGIYQPSMDGGGSVVVDCVCGRRLGVRIPSSVYAGDVIAMRWDRGLS